MLISDRMEQGATNYAQADRSDPFAYNRAMTHLKNGVASISNAKGEDAFYTATQQQEKRSYKDRDGAIIEYHVPVYTNVARP